MNEIEYYFFENLRIYHEKSKQFNHLPIGNPPLRSSLNVTKNDFYKATYDLGNYNGNRINNRSKFFYGSLVRFMIEIKSGKFYKRNDFKEAESSIVSALNFFMGMISAKIVADKMHDVKILYHLTDTNAFAHELVINNKVSDKHPDFIGINRYNEPIIVEAKGTKKGKFSTSVTINASDQLEAIKEIKVLNNDGSTKLIYNNAIKKHIIGSTYYGKDNKLTFHDIDPHNSGEGVLNVDLNLLTYNYYHNYMVDILTNPNKYDIERNIIKADLGEYIIGLNIDIYEQLKEYSKSYRNKIEVEDIEIDDNLQDRIYEYLVGTETNEYYYSDGVYFEYKGE